MTLFKIYKGICKVINIEPVYKSSELKPIVLADDRLIIALKNFSDKDIEKELDYISKTYFDVLSHVDQELIKERMKNIEIYRYHPKPNLDIDLNTIISIIYISKYIDKEYSNKIILDAIQVLFKTKKLNK